MRVIDHDDVGGAAIAGRCHFRPSLDSAENVESNVVREAVLRVWDELVPTRLNDPKTGMFIVIMQRSHERDLIGHILAKEFNGMHVCLPAEFEGDHPYVFHFGVQRAQIATPHSCPTAAEHPSQLSCG